MTPRAEHLDIIYRWLKYKDHVDMATVLHNLSYNTVAIYGGGVLGELLYDYLYSTDISVRCIIDQNPNLEFPYDVDIVLPSQFLGDGCDAVIVTPLDYDNIKKSLQVDCPIISLNNLIPDVDVLQDFFTAVEHIEKAGTQLLIIDVTNAIKQVKNPSINELTLLAHHSGLLREESSTHMKLLLKYYDDLPNCSEKYIRDVYYDSFKRHTVKMDGIPVLQNTESKHFNVVNGIRYTFGNPQTYSNEIHFYGNCLAIGLLAQDSLTIESQLQCALNAEPLHNKMYRVLNRANWRDVEMALPLIINTKFCDGDIAVLITRDEEWLKHYLNSKAVHYHDVAGIFDRPHDMGEIFFDSYYHMNHRGYKLIANKIYSILSELPMKIASEDKVGYEVIVNGFTPRKTYSKLKLEPLLEEYLSFLKKEKVDCWGTIGSIVMNCNPFTLGHKYLIEEAQKQCDFLYIFVVEEDKSFFPFADRLMLVKANTEELENVQVLPSGSFIISTLTFPEYFIKDSVYVKIDASKDIKIFAEYIAPALNITKRFVGEEPFDSITNQYNQAMVEDLPRKGIAVMEIPRIQADCVPISASLVRKLLENDDFDEISKLVPNKTLEYLKTLQGKRNEK